jgi:hypothetical protein
MSQPSDINSDDNWVGGFYELSIDLGSKDDSRLDRALRALWRHAAVGGCFAPRYQNNISGDRAPLRLTDHVAVPIGLASLEESGHLRGTVRLPSGVEIVCGAVAVRFDEDPDWLDFYLPLGALADVDRRIGGFPFGEDSDAGSLSWRLPLDRWLAEIGSRVFEEVPFGFARIGFEASGEPFPPDETYFGRLVAGDDRLDYLEAER